MLVAVRRKRQRQRAETEDLDLAESKLCRDSKHGKEKSPSEQEGGG